MDVLGVSKVRLLPKEEAAITREKVNSSKIAADSNKKKDPAGLMRAIVNLTRKSKVISSKGGGPSSSYAYSVNSKLTNLFQVLKFEKVTRNLENCI